MTDDLPGILRPEQARYLDTFLPPRDALRREMEAFAAEHDVPISHPAVGRLLEIEARVIGARRCLEVGTAIGYGALCLALGSPEAQVVSIDRDPERLALARGFLARAGVGDRVELVEGEALEVLQRLEPPFDLVYLDATKGEYRRYLDYLLPKLTVGGLVVVDNLLWGGRVAEPPDDEDAEEEERTEAIRAFNGYLLMHPQLTSVIVPLGDGVGLATKTRPLVTELGGPY